jgi:hypothetical protein
MLLRSACCADSSSSSLMIFTLPICSGAA